MGIKLKMTVWYTLLALLTAGLMGALLFYAAQRSALRYYSDTLEAASALARSQLEYESGNLEIDDDLDDIPDVHIALYTGSGTLIYGRTRVELPFAQYALPTYYIVSSAEASSNLARFDGVKYGYRSEHYDGLVDLYFKSRSEGFGPEVRRRIMLGTYVLASGYYDAYYKRAQLMRVKLKQVYDEAFERCDVLLTPASPTVAFRLGEKESDPLAMYLSDICTVSINMVELPALVLPCGTVEGLPMGMQLIGRKFSEELLYNVAYSFEQATGLGWTCPKL